MEYKIGDFALITRLSIKTLRFYHEAGLIEPTRVAEESGYRYYASEQINKFRIIRTLKTWGFTIQEIKTILSDYSEDSDLLELIQQKRTEVKGKILNLKKIEEELAFLIRYEKESENMKENKELTIKDIGKIQIISISYRGRYDECGKYLGILYKIGGSKAAGNPFNRYPDEEYAEEAEIEVCLPVKRKIDHPDVDYKVLGPAKVVSAIHHGSYDEIGRAYQRLIDYRNDFSIKTKGPGREIYIKGPGMIFQGNPKRYITEIQMVI